jgi:hypothetical protein
VSFKLLPLYPRGKCPRYALDRRLDGPQNRSRRYGEVKILDPTKILNSETWIVQPVASRSTDYATMDEVQTLLPIDLIANC